MNIRKIDIQDITQEDILAFLESKPDEKAISEERMHLVEYLDLLDRIRSMDRKTEIYGSTESIYQYLIKQIGLSRLDAEKAYSDAMEFFYSSNQLTVEAFANRQIMMAQEELNLARSLTKDSKELVNIAKQRVDLAMKYAELNKKPFEVPEEIYKKLAVIYSTDAKALGLLNDQDYSELEEWIDAQEDLTEREKDLAKKEAMLIPFNAIPHPHENIRKSE